jgi:hypothetical protein
VPKEALIFCESTALTLLILDPVDFHICLCKHSHYIGEMEIKASQLICLISIDVIELQFKKEGITTMPFYNCLHSFCEVSNSIAIVPKLHALTNNDHYPYR